MMDSAEQVPLSVTVPLTVLAGIAVVSFVPEELSADFTLDLRPLVLALFVPVVAAMTCLGVHGNRGYGFRIAATDTAFAATVVVSLVSFACNARALQAFYCVQLACAGFVVYLAIRSAGTGTVSTAPRRWASVGSTTRATAFLLAVLGASHAMTALVQYAAGYRPSGTFGNPNLLALFLALTAPMTLALWLDNRGVTGTGGNRAARVLRSCAFPAAFLLQAAAIGATGCRTAYAALGLALPVTVAGWPWLAGTRLGRAVQPWRSRHRTLAAVTTSALVVAAAVCAARILWQLKPVSAAGRVLAWRVSALMFSDNLLTGVGFGNFGCVYHQYQARFFAAGLGSSPQIMAADRLCHAFNWYLETAAELGLAGLVVYGMLWLRIAIETAAARAWSMQTSARDGRLESGNALVTAGMAGSLASFMVMALFHFPYKIVPVYLVFVCILALTVTGNQSRRPATDAGWRTMPAGWLTAFWAVVFVVSLVLVPVHCRRYGAAREWRRAESLARAGKPLEAAELFRTVHARLGWNARFLARYADVLMQQQPGPGDGGRVPMNTGSPERAAPLYELSTILCADPYTYEKMGIAYARLAARGRQTNGTAARPAALDAQYTARALKVWQMASDILPWRLTPKYYMARLYYDLGDTANARKYGQLILDTPLKKATREGIRMKSEARTLTARLDAPRGGFVDSSMTTTGGLP